MPCLIRLGTWLGQLRLAKGGLFVTSALRETLRLAATLRSVPAQHPHDALEHTSGIAHTPSYGRAKPTASLMASKACLSRLQKEYQRLSKEPLPDVVAEPRCDFPSCANSNATRKNTEVALRQIGRAHAGQITSSSGTL